MQINLTKNNNLNRWVWKWHMIAGLISLPFMFLLAITGIIYLFKQDYNDNVYQHIKFVQAADETSKVSYIKQLESAKQHTDKPIVALTLPQRSDQASAFKMKGQGFAQDLVYVDPYSGKVTGEVLQKQTDMHLVRKLHGELLLDTPGTLTIELIASWFFVLLLTGLYVWWPKDRFKTAGFFTIRTHQGKRIFWRDLHAVLGFWLSIFMLVILAGGMPWTNVFGDNLKWVQKQTNTGYPMTWRSGHTLKSAVDGAPLNLDQMVFLAQQQNLEGKVTIKLPQKPSDVFTVSNTSLWLEDQRVIHFDRYSGAIVKQHTWDDVGVLMDVRMIFMRLHQGEYTKANWWIVLIVALLFTFSTAAGLISYLKRKPQGDWGITKVPAAFRVDAFLVAIVIAIGLLFPMFGISLLLVSLISWWRNRKLQSLTTSTV